MQSSAKKLLLAALLLVACSVCAIFYATRATRSDVDHSVAAMLESYICPHCGQGFKLSIADATEMRRSKGNILCPKCRKPGALKDAPLASTDLVNDSPPPGVNNDEEESGETDAPHPQSKPTRPTGTLTKNPAP